MLAECAICRGEHNEASFPKLTSWLCKLGKEFDETRIHLWSRRPAAEAAPPAAEAAPTNFNIFLNYREVEDGFVRGSVNLLLIDRKQRSNVAFSLQQYSVF